MLRAFFISGIILSVDKKNLSTKKIIYRYRKILVIKIKIKIKN